MSKLFAITTDEFGTDGYVFFGTQEQMENDVTETARGCGFDPDEMLAAVEEYDVADMDIPEMKGILRQAESLTANIPAKIVLEMLEKAADIGWDAGQRFTGKIERV